jgi:signal transduction histidine kinase
MGAEAAHALARVVREAVTNAAVHGQATRVTVDVHEDQERIVMAIHDDGVGFDPADVRPSGFGLVSIRERVAGLGGELSIESAHRAGTRIRVAIPRPEARRVETPLARVSAERSIGLDRGS